MIYDRQAVQWFSYYFILHSEKFYDEWPYRFIIRLHKTTNRWMCTNSKLKKSRLRLEKRVRTVRTDAKNERETDTDERSETLTAATHHNDAYGWIIIIHSFRKLYYECKSCEIVTIFHAIILSTANCRSTLVTITLALRFFLVFLRIRNTRLS